MTNRREFISQITMAASAATFLRPFKSFANIEPQPNVFIDTLTILHTADLQGQWQALHPNQKLRGLGGMHQLQQQLATIKKKSAATLLIHSGNIIGHRNFNSDEYQHLCKAMGQAGYDAIVPGEMDLSKKKELFLQLANENKLPFISSGSPFGNTALLPFTIVNKGTIRVAIIDAASICQRSLRLQVAAITKTAEMLRGNRHCSLVICVAAAAGKEYHSLATLSSGIDVIICSTGKTSIYNTEIFRNKMGQEVILSYAGKQGTMISRLDLTLGEQGKNGFISKAVFVGTKEESYVNIMKKYNLSHT